MMASSSALTREDSALTREELLDIQADALADDIELEYERMKFWTAALEDFVTQIGAVRVCHGDATGPPSLSRIIKNRTEIEI